LTTREGKTTFHVIIVVSGDSIPVIASSDDCEDGDNVDDEETEQGKVREDDKPGWVMGTFTTMVQQGKE
jgi:hypothetical protein